MKVKCRFCNRESERLQTDGMSEGCRCPHCGEYEVSYFCLATMYQGLSEKSKANIARSLASNKKYEVITSDYVERFI